MVSFIEKTISESYTIGKSTETYEEIVKNYKVGSNSKQNLARLGIILQKIQSTLDFKVGSRGWCYILEGQKIQQSFQQWETLKEPMI